jgi:hypothetical protein
MDPHAVRVLATVEEVLPRFGLAYLVDERQVTWGITKNAAGPGLERLQAGQRVTLEVQQHPHFSLVSRYELAA